MLQETEFRRDLGRRVHHGGGKQQGGRGERGHLPQVPHENSDRRQGPRHAEGQQQQRQDQHGQPEDARGESCRGEHRAHQHEDQADRQVEQRGPEVGQRQRLQREDDLLHKVRIGDDHARRPSEGLREGVEQSQSEEESEGEVEVGLPRDHPEPLPVDQPEDDEVQRQHRERRQQRPDRPEAAPPVAHLDVAARELPDQSAPCPQPRDHPCGFKDQCLHQRSGHSRGQRGWPVNARRQPSTAAGATKDSAQASSLIPWLMTQRPPLNAAPQG